MMDKAIFRLKSQLALIHRIPSLQNSVEADLEEGEEMRAETQGVDL